MTGTESKRARIEPLTRLATGGMAEIWLARELGPAGLERFVVVKRLLPHLNEVPNIVDMFVSEARFVARLVHPNVVQIHELAQDGEGYFLVMEYVEGCTVRELTTAAELAGELLLPSVAVCVVEQACRGAHAAHELTDAAGQSLGLVHRDISPHNLMITPGGDVKLLDFGIAKATELAEATNTGSLKGKCSYMSPEQCRAQRLDRRSDVFALGIVLWELLVGERLFNRASEYASMQAIVTGDFRLPSEVRPDLGESYDAVIEKALATEPDERFQTADELRRALLAAATSAGERPSRDALSDVLESLCGGRMERRRDALKEALAAGGEGREQSTPVGPDEPTVSDRSRAMRSSRPEADTAKDGGDGGDAPASGDAVESPVSQPGLGRGARLALVGTVVALLVVLVGALVSRYSGSDQQVAPSTTATASAASSIDPSLPPLRLVFAPVIEPEVLRREIQPFGAWLGRRLGQRVEITVPPTYAATGELLRGGEAEVGLLPPLLFVQTQATDPRIRPVVLRLYEGSRGSDGYLLVRDDAAIADAAGLRGHTICLVDETSTTGYLLPRIWMRKRDIDPEKDVETILSGDHLAALRDLAKGRCEAAAVYSGAYLSAQSHGIQVGPMRVLSLTGYVPQEVVVVSPSYSDEQLRALEKVLLEFDAERDVGASRVGAVLGLDGFAKYEPEEFTAIREAAAAEGLLPTP